MTDDARVLIDIIERIETGLSGSALLDAAVSVGWDLGHSQTIERLRLIGKRFGEVADEYARHADGM